MLKWVEQDAGLITKRAIYFMACLIALVNLFTPMVLHAEVNPLYTDAQRQFDEKHFDSAIVLFTALIQQQPDKKEGYYNRGLAFYSAGNYPQAIADFDHCLQIDSSFTDAQFMKANALEKKGALKQSIAELERLKTKDSGYDEVEKRIKNYRLTVYLSENWYYMIAMMFLGIVLIAVVAKSLSYKRE